ncbi:hypothetical protein WG66_007361 [Moniliophthora roreri]|nr:hypothetical protein WG66_007361 [Moniliophthora roreri]
MLANSSSNLKYLPSRDLTAVSSRNYEFLKSLSADAIFDYRDPEVVNKTTRQAGGQGKVANDSNERMS